MSSDIKSFLFVFCSIMIVIFMFMCLLSYSTKIHDDAARACKLECISKNKSINICEAVCE